LSGQRCVLGLAKCEERDDEDDEKDSRISSAQHLDFLILLAKPRHTSQRMPDG
jgi:hypothetical protein